MASFSDSAKAGAANEPMLIAMATADTTPNLVISLKTPDPCNTHLQNRPSVLGELNHDGYISSIHHSSTKTLNFADRMTFSPSYCFSATPTFAQSEAHIMFKHVACRGLPPQKHSSISRLAANEASWRNGYAEDCKSLNGGSIPSEASISSS
jgi:hypothetical protein